MAAKEYREKDASGRIPLSAREYAAIRAIYGSVNVLANYHSELERRCRGFKNGWRDLRCLVVLSEKLLYKVLKTVPVKKLMQMKKELDNTVCEVKVQGVSGRTNDGFMYVSEDAIVSLCEAATEVHCFGCTKTHKEAKRKCPIYKSIQNVFNYDFDTPESGKCPLSEGDD